MKTKFTLFIFLFLMYFSPCVSFAAFSKGEVKKPDTSLAKEPATATIEEAMKEFNSLSKHEKKSRIKEMKKAIKEYKAQKKQGSDVSTNTLLLVIIGILIPPLAVYLHEGEINNRFWISVLLTLLGYLLFGFAGIFFLGSLPGIIYALYVILSGT
ncbi:YqaE/Pmp3 family membrane protein [Segetibacter koreensis]|uniref:YqaE/Pmp3 family membrane protein n=1 Tax=Segetibacter koreensis TaxID=398037 RepID=UPI000379907F|nr:YqaE/Pmp3 family membrane protein [Segetibacter koreensis]